MLSLSEAAGDLLPPFIDYLRGEVLSSGLLGTDDTRVTLLFPAAHADKKPSVTARLWVYRSQS